MYDLRVAYSGYLTVLSFIYYIPDRFSHVCLLCDFHVVLAVLGSYFSEDHAKKNDEQHQICLQEMEYTRKCVVSKPYTARSRKFRKGAIRNGF